MTIFMCITVFMNVHISVYITPDIQVKLCHQQSVILLIMMTIL
jgi:hypothetical protein